MKHSCRINSSGKIEANEFFNAFLDAIIFKFNVALKLTLLFLALNWITFSRVRPRTLQKSFDN